MPRTSRIHRTTAALLAVALTFFASFAQAQAPGGVTEPSASLDPISEDCPCTALVAALAQAEVELARAYLEVHLTSVRVVELAKERFAHGQALRDTAKELGGTISEEKIAAEPGMVAVQKRYDESLVQSQVARDVAYARVRRVDELKARLRACLERCAILEPQVRFVLGGPNNPFNPLGPVKPAADPGPYEPNLVSFQFDRFNAAEGGVAVVSVFRSVIDLAGPAGVSYTTVSGTATAGADFTPMSGTLSWGDKEGGTKTIAIPIARDNIAEGPETFVVALSNPTGLTRLGARSIATVTITDADQPPPPPPPQNPGTLQFSLPVYETSEGAAQVTITVTRTGGSAGSAQVDYNTGPSTATSPADYGAVTGRLNWGPGDAAAKTFTIPIVDDTLVEGSETFFVQLVNASGATLGGPAVATVAIQDNDQAPAGPCGPQGNAWQPNTGAPYTCTGICDPNANNPVVTVNGTVVTIARFHAGGDAVFNGCTASLDSQSNTLTYFTRAIHRATINRTGNNAFTANIVASTGAQCNFSCSRPGP